jgi:hypothetical protein
VRNQPSQDVDSIDTTPIGYDADALKTEASVVVKIFIVGFIVAILYSLVSSFYFLVRDKGEGDRTVRRLSWRIGLSLLLVLLLYVGFELGIIEPRGVDPVVYPSPSQQQSATE